MTISGGWGYPVTGSQLDFPAGNQNVDQETSESPNLIIFVAMAICCWLSLRFIDKAKTHITEDILRSQLPNWCNKRTEMKGNKHTRPDTKTKEDHFLSFKRSPPPTTTGPWLRQSTLGEDARQWFQSNASREVMTSQHRRCPMPDPSRSRFSPKGLKNIHGPWRHLQEGELPLYALLLWASEEPIGGFRQNHSYSQLE